MRLNLSSLGLTFSNRYVSFVSVFILISVFSSLVPSSPVVLSMELVGRIVGTLEILFVRVMEVGRTESVLLSKMASVWAGLVVETFFVSVVVKEISNVFVVRGEIASDCGDVGMFFDDVVVFVVVRSGIVVDVDDFGVVEAETDVRVCSVVGAVNEEMSALTKDLFKCVVWLNAV